MRLSRAVLATFLALHGLAHLIGFTIDWELTDGASARLSTGVIGGIDVGTPGMRVLGVLWVVASLAFLAAIAGVARDAPWDATAIVPAAGFSAVLCIAQIGTAWIGLVIDAAILIGVARWRWRDDAHRAGFGTAR